MADSSPSQDASSISAAEAKVGILSSHGISLNLPDGAAGSGSGSGTGTGTGSGRPAAVKHLSLPAYSSPIRHHRRTTSRTQKVKETPNARSRYSSTDDDGAAIHSINQYVIKQEIGRGSFGAVHLAVDQYGTEYAVKEFSKARLRKRAQSNLLRRPNQKKRPGHLAAGTGFNSPLHRISSRDKAEQKDNNSLDLIKEEIAIMKKLDHHNVVNLIEVLDDPEEDSLYMVLEMCKKGVVMKVGLEETADPYDDETCRCWFRDMILGIEYLHAQGIIHRDIKPDNCLITEDDVLKIVDFGVSEMFEKESDMSTAKSAGSPAFMPPELCVARHGEVSGRAADIWSMGATLYCLRYGRIPFEKHGMLELFESIRNDELSLNDEQDRNFTDLITRLLEKDPNRRITMEDLREHAWVTKSGTDRLLSAEENCANLVELPTEAELNQAITGNMKKLLVVMRAVRRFKKLLSRGRPEGTESILGRSSRIVAPPGSFLQMSGHAKAHSVDSEWRRPMERMLASAGVHHDLKVTDDLKCLPKSMSNLALSGDGGANDEDKKEAAEAEAPVAESEIRRVATPASVEHTRGHAHDPLLDTLFLDIGAGPESPAIQGGEHVVSESPGAVDTNVYEAAYQQEMQRILEQRGRDASIYLTRRVEGNKAIREHESVIDNRSTTTSPARGLAGIVKKAREQANTDVSKSDEQEEERTDDQE